VTPLVQPSDSIPAVTTCPGAAYHRGSLVDMVHASFPAREVPVAVELIDAALAGDPEYRLLVAEGTGGESAGYVCYGPTPMTQGTYDLYWIATHLRVRRRGVAGYLLRVLENTLVDIGATAIRVETSDTEVNAAARRLYRRCGYPEVARLSDFYGPGDGLVLYYKRL